MTIEFEVEGKKYQAARLKLFDQIPIAKRLMPMLKNVMTEDVMRAVIAAKMQGGESGENAEKAKIDWLTMLPAMCDAVYSLKDEDAERIIRTALKVVQRQENGVWANIMAPGANGTMMFSDLDDNMGTTMQIVWKVLEGHLGSFFSIAR